VTPPPPDDDGGVPRSPRIRPFLSAPPGEPVGPPAAHAPRPFVLTSGRVAPDPDIGLHTQVTTRIEDPYTTYGLASELRAIVALCVEPMSIAEISARLGLHLGVTKILVGDLRAGGYLDVHVEDVRDHDYSHDPETILRVIDGLRAFS
jgi:Protein of unknown function (DUF742)